ncbi:uncharacterized protein LOC128859921 isoform X2 [Anastrepha ludens]|uniref:uncharacterized protein LOC128859921 isoform X2 n=1 Tax=Anastrepha ludens TaxID=28586 RepID=UPI0023AFA0BD|nr:uncharacterized protein LOC128859921 isoform X2 [Anastrepha ludens]
MLKKFVTLQSDISPSKNPYEVRTYMGDTPPATNWKAEMCEKVRKCERPNNSTITKVMTIEDELRRLNQKVKESRFQREVKKKCGKTDEYFMCTQPQRTPIELREHSVMRERFLRAAYDLTRRVHDGSEVPLNAPSHIELVSPVQSQEEEDEGRSTEEEEGEEEEKKSVRPKLASPSCSMDVIYEPSEKLLELKRPKSGMFHNETQQPLPPSDEDVIPYINYNPRLLQQRFDEQNLQRVDLIQGRDPNDLWTWNIAMQQHESQLDRAFLDASTPKFDCKHLELTTFKIPNDLDKTFTAEIVFGTESIQPEEKPKKQKPSYFNRPKEIACLFAAYVESFRFNPDFWTSETLDGILATGEKLLKKSINLNYKSPDNDFDILPQILDKQAEVGFKLHFTGPLDSEPNIYKVLSLYFSKYNAAVLTAKDIYLLIWKRCTNTFYIFDPYGRDELCQRDFAQGNCSLMAVIYVEHLVHLLINFSKADVKGEFSVYEISIKSFGKISSPIPNKPFPKRTHRLWAVVNGTYAIIPAVNNGLQQPIAGTEQNGSMIISLLALLYSNIEQASTWRMEVIDELVKFGIAFYKNFLKRLKLKKKQLLNIVDIPDAIMLGAFRATLKKHPFLYTGHVTNCKSYLESQLTAVVSEVFGSSYEAALLQIDNSVLAIWRDGEFYYLFDPFRRGKAGQVLDPEDFLTKGVACLQMHSNFESFSRILYQKALKLRRGGKFFIHGINIGCIRPMLSSANIKNKYPRLQIAFPKLAIKSEQDKRLSKKGKGKKKLVRTYSIQSIPDEDRIPEFEDADVVAAVLDEIICDIIEQIFEPTPSRLQLYKQADKVLLRSDKEYLRGLRYKLIHGEDYDNVYTEFQKQPEQPPRPLTLEEELEIRTNFKKLPDGSWVVMGKSYIPVEEDEVSKLNGLLSTLVATALSAKYNISTWNKELVDYAVESSNGFGEEFSNYEATLRTFLSKKMPKINIGKNIYMLHLQRVIQSSVKRTLRQRLLESLLIYNRLIVVCQIFSCLIVKRYNFLYMFIAFPCTSVGYRKFGSGPGCLLRFVELDALIRRIEFGCNPQGCEITNYVVVAIKVLDITNVPPKRYMKLPPDIEESIYATEYERKQKMDRLRMDKIRFLDRELLKENERIQRFLEEKEEKIAARAQRGKTKGKRTIRMELSTEYAEEDEEFEEYDMDEMEEFEEEEVELKHKPGKRLERELDSGFKPRKILFGYRMREKDCNFKIQGTIALKDRASAHVDKIKPCFFASTLAVLYAVMRPLNQWSAQRVDHVIESGKTIASRVTNMTSAYERFIKNVTVDDYKFDVWVKTHDPPGVKGANVSRKITKSMQARKYLLLQLANTTFALFHDEYYHLFDPYPTMEKSGEGEEEEEDDNDGDYVEKEGPRKGKCKKRVKRYGERNTASWVLFADVDSLLKYVDKRASNPTWQASEEYALHVIDVISYRKAGPKTRLLQLLTDLSVPIECKTAMHGKDEEVVCAHPETMSWLDSENCLPVWSRMNRRNTAGRYRNLPVTMLKRFDIEIDGRLWSLWGNLHPDAPVFGSTSRGKQYLACNVMALCAAKMYSLTDWSPHLLDTIVINGDRYHRESLENIKLLDYEFSLEDLNLDCTLENIKFVVHLEHVAFGKLYSPGTRTTMNLADALMYFFTRFQFGVLQCFKHSLAIGRTMGFDGGFFMFDCQSKDQPLFPNGQGASYLLRTNNLQVLLYCIVVTLNVPYYNVNFTLHKVEMLREGASLEEEGEDGSENTGDN